jgi:hypothetical protein
MKQTMSFRLCASSSVFEASTALPISTDYETSKERNKTIKPAVLEEFWTPILKP